MSFLIFPTFTPFVGGQGQWNYKYPIKQSPEYNTIQQMPASGRGPVRIPLREFPLWNFTWDIGYLRGDNQGVNTAWQTLVNFIMAVQGAAASWLFLHPFDNTVSSSAPITIGIGDGTTTQFSIIRTLVTGGAQDLVQNFVSPPTIYINGTSISPAFYSIDQYGTVTFIAGHIPTAGQVIAWSGQFYYLCHFVDDKQDSLQEFLYQIWELGELKFQSVLL
jgi:Conserved hypothetical protein 2217 (DUF2460)